jgi:hypothetical protein
MIGRRTARRIPLARPAIVGAVLLAVVLVLLVVSPALAFPDVPVTHPYYQAITDLTARGIIGGYDDGTFGPGDPASRQQFAKMIVLNHGV